MKNIEEAAKEYAKITSATDRVLGQFTGKESAFKAGVEFAQKWIDCKVELPENNLIQEQGLIKAYGLLVRCPNDMIYIADRVYSDDHGKFIWRYKIDGGRIFDVISWRPINIT